MHLFDFQESSDLSSEQRQTTKAFIREQSDFCHSVMRLAIDWSKKINMKCDAVIKHAVIELVGLQAALNEEKRVLEEKGEPSLFYAFNSYLSLLGNLPALHLVFDEYYSKDEIDRSFMEASPVLVDPSNPSRNLLGTGKATDELLTNIPHFAINAMIFLNDPGAW